MKGTVELGYNLMKETQYVVLLQISVVLTKDRNAMVNRSELNGTT
jgi:hypothetical protein